MKPTQEQVIAWAREAGLHIATDVHWMPIIGLEYLEKATALAYEAGQKDALSNIDPSKLMSYQEGYEAGRKDENEANKNRIETLYKMYEQASQQRDELMQAQPDAIRARREQ